MSDPSIHEAFLSISSEQWEALKRLDHHERIPNSKTKKPRSATVLSLLAIEAVKGGGGLTRFGHKLRHYGPVCATFEELRAYAKRELEDAQEPLKSP